MYLAYDRLVTMWVSVWQLVTILLLLAAIILALFLIFFWKHLTFNHRDFHCPPLTCQVLNLPSHLQAPMNAFLISWKYVFSQLTLAQKYFCSFQGNSNFVYQFFVAFLSLFVVVAIIFLQFVTFRRFEQTLCTPLDVSNSTDSEPSTLLGSNGSLPPFSAGKDAVLLANNSFHPFSYAKVEQLPSQNIIVRAAYYDPRQRNGHINATVFLIEVIKHLRNKKSIIGCGVGNKVTTDLSIRGEITQSYTHDVTIVDCFDLPVKSGLKAFIWYKIKRANSRTADLIRVESEEPCFVPTPKQSLNKDDVKIVTCMSTLWGFPPYLNEFIRYQKYLGVDHIHITGEDSIIRNGIFQSDGYVLKALHEGYISFTFWHSWLTESQIFYHSQRLGYYSCIQRFQGTYDYVFIMDSDDYFISLVPNTNFKYYIDKYCHIGSCIFPRIEFYPDCGVQWKKLGEHGNVTNILVSHVSSKMPDYAGKSLSRISGILDPGVHQPMDLLHGYHNRPISPSVAYVAHIRIKRKPPGGMNAC